MKNIVYAASLMALLAAAGCQPRAGDGQPAATNTSADTPDSMTTEEPRVDTLQMTDTVTGDGALAEAGKNIVVHYSGWLYDPAQADNKGTKFDSSLDRGQPFQFPLGAGRVIQGWDQGFAGMQVGGKRVLIIPPDMGYGASGAGDVIPPNATLLFEVELLEVQ